MLKEHVQKGELLKISVAELEPVRQRLEAVKALAAAASAAGALDAMGDHGAGSTTNGRPDDATVSALLLSLVSSERLSPPLTAAVGDAATGALPVPPTATARKRKQPGEPGSGSGKRRKSNGMAAGETGALDPNASPDPAKPAAVRKPKVPSTCRDRPHAARWRVR